MNPGDFESLEQALILDERLGDGPELAKVGLQLFAAAGPEAVRALRRRGRRVFLDLKLHDIPNTVGAAAAEAAKLGAELITVHAMGGEAMIRAAVLGIERVRRPTRVVAVTLLTSLDPADLPPGFSRPFPLADVQAGMLAIAESAGALGIVCSANDLAGIRERHPEPFYAVTPGIRPRGGAAHDQVRVTAIADAVAMGARMLVLGRAITAAADPRAALDSALREAAEAARTPPIPH